MLQSRMPRTSRESSPRSDRSTSSFEQALAADFGGSIVQADYVGETAGALGRLGFARDNTLACVAACRDEIASSLLVDVDHLLADPFSLVSLAGMVTAGRTGLRAALAHAPVVEGRRRVVCYAMPHIAISEAGIVGEVQRPGLQAPSRACGALHAFRQQLTGDGTELGFDPLDAEQSLLSARLLPVLPALDPGSVPDLVDLVQLTAQAIEDDLWELFQQVAAGQLVDSALFTGVQVHGPGGANYVWPRSGYVLVDGNVQVIDHRSPTGQPSGGHQGRSSRTRRWLARGAAASTAVVLLSARQQQERS